MVLNTLNRFKNSIDSIDLKEIENLNHTDFELFYVKKGKHALKVYFDLSNPDEQNKGKAAIFIQQILKTKNIKIEFEGP